MSNDDDKTNSKRWRLIMFIALLAVAVFFYASIMYKIINYGA